MESEKAENALKATSFAGKSVSELRDKINTAKGFEAKAEETNRKTAGKTQLVLKVMAIVVSLALGVAVGVIIDSVLIGAIVALAFIGSSALIIRSVNRANFDDSGERLELLLGSLGCKSIDELEEKTEIYAELCDDADKARINLEGARQSLDSAEKALKNAKALALEKISLIMPGVSDASAAAQRIGMVDELIDRCAKAEFEAVSAQNEFEALVTRCGGEMPELDETFTTAPIRNLEDTKA